MQYFNIISFLLKVGGVVSCMVFVITLSVSAAFCADKFIESGDYKSKNFRKGCIDDYSNLIEGDDLKWQWVAEGVKLADYKVSVKSFKDTSDELKKTQLEGFKNIFTETFEKTKGTQGTLKAEVCVYEVQKFSAGKAWIPFAGGHQMQAGVGAEVVLKNSQDKIVAMFRHFAREGAQVEQAAEEVADDIKKYISNN